MQAVGFATPFIIYLCKPSLHCVKLLFLFYLQDNPESTIEPIPPSPTTTTTTTTTLNDPPQIITSPAVAVDEKEEETPPTTVQEEELEDDSIESCSDTTPLNP